MKRMILLIAALFALAAPAASFAMEHGDMTMDTKDGMRECALQAESIQQKIGRVQGEISKGSTKYSAVELKKLNEKLKEANDTLDGLVKR